MINKKTYTELANSCEKSEIRQTVKEIIYNKNTIPVKINNKIGKLKNAIELVNQRLDSLTSLIEKIAYGKLFKT